MGKLNGLDLFSGIAGNTLGLNEWINTVAYCEADLYAQSVLLSRMSEGKLSKRPIWDDITTLTKEQINVPVDIIVAGFPCQDISVAGHGAGIENGERSGLFYQIVRLVNELQPSFIFLENVPAIRTRGLDIVLQQLTEAGYDAKWTMLSASSVGTVHKRERWFLLAYNRKERGNGKFQEKIQREPLLQGSKNVGSFENEIRRPDLFEPKLCRNLHDVPFTVDRLARVGNSVVPEQAKKAFKILMGLE